jgi:1-acyl-sn-glycerol-3-phosphate acyltransferase
VLAIVRVPLVIIAFIVINFLILLLCIIRPFHRNNIHYAGQLYSQISKLLGLKIVLRVSPSVRADTPYIFIANHQNSYDIITICKAALPGVVTVGKKSLKWIPIFGQIYWLTGNIMIDRNNSGRARDTLALTAQKIAQKKTSVWFFPEGTRSNGRGLLPFKVGAFRLAQSTNVPMVMVTASNLHQKIKWNRWDNGTLLIDIDAPQHLSKDHSAKQWMAIYHDKMAKKINDLNRQVAEIEKSR